MNEPNKSIRHRGTHPTENRNDHKRHKQDSKRHRRVIVPFVVRSLSLGKAKSSAIIGPSWIRSETTPADSPSIPA